MSIARGRKDGITQNQQTNNQNKTNDTYYHQHQQHQQQQQQQQPEVETEWGIPVQDARPLLPKASFFLGDLRDGLPMVCLYFFFLADASDLFSLYSVWHI